MSSPSESGFRACQSRPPSSHRISKRCSAAPTPAKRAKTKQCICYMFARTDGGGGGEIMTPRSLPAPKPKPPLDASPLLLYAFFLLRQSSARPRHSETLNVRACAVCISALYVQICPQRSSRENRTSSSSSSFVRRHAEESITVRFTPGSAVGDLHRERGRREIKGEREIGKNSSTFSRISRISSSCKNIFL